MQLLAARARQNHQASYPALTLTGTYPDASGGDAYSEDLTIAGGNGSYSLTGGDGVVSGTLPTGLSLSISGSSLTLSGTPTAAFSGSFTVGVDSGDGQSATSVQSPDITPVTYATWNPADATTGIALSNGNTRAAIGTSVRAGTVRSTGSITGKRYFELVIYPISGVGGVVSGGVASSDDNISDSTLLGYDSTGYGVTVFQTNGRIRFTSSLIDELGVAIGYVICFAVDASTREVWIKMIQDSVWSGGGDPSLGTNPTVTINGTGTLHAAAMPYSYSNYVDIISDPADMTGTAPSGFIAGLVE